MKKKFKKEFRRQIRLAIAAAIGFIIAFSWRDFIINITNGWIESIDQIAGAHLAGLTSSLVITIIGVLFILLASKLLE